jgi:hypothetical protein
VRWRERLLEHGPIRHLVNIEPHPDHIRANAYCPGAAVIDVIRKIDPCPIGQRMFAMSDNITERTIRNVYKHVVARQTATAAH